MNTSSNGNIKFITIKSIEDFQIVVGKSVVNIFPMHVHRKFCIGLIEKGNAILVHNNNTIRLSNGCIYLINLAQSNYETEERGNMINRYGLALFGILVSLRLFFVGVYFFLEYFADNAPSDLENGFAIAMAAITVSLFGLGINVIFHIIVLRRTSVEKRFKIDINEIFLNRKDRLLRNIIRILGYLSMIYFLAIIGYDVFIKGKLYLEFYCWSIICTCLYIIWINNIFRRKDAVDV